jgi:serine/threonine protein kinase/tetratricopeptide (TPR) repeat protein
MECSDRYMQPDDDKTRTYVPLTSGTVVSHYRVIEKIGAGGMGEVYLAEDTELNRKVALKFLPPHLCQDADCRARFKREAQAAAKLSHPNIITIHEVNEYSGRPFFTMEYIEGDSLVDFIKKRDHSTEKIIDLSIQICEGLNKAHQAGIIHRDIKPSNILIDKDGRAKILDFGLAAIKGVDKLTKTGSTLGTLNYMSPEQTRGEEVDYCSDIFSFGAVLYEMITGQLPFKGEHEPAIIYSIGYEEPEPLARFKSGVPDELQGIVTKTLAKDKKLRYQHVDDLLVDLKAFCRQSAFHVLAKQPSIAVLSFANLSSDPEQEYFCDGMAEEIINALSHMENLQVVARTSALSFKGQAIDIREIGRRLGVKTVLEGSVRRSGNRLRITTQLVDVASGYHLWSEKFDRDLEDIFVIQDEISLAVVENLRVRLQIGDETRLAKRHTEDPVAYGLYLKGRYFWNKRSEEDIKKAMSLFKQATQADSGYAPAYAGLADCYIILAYYDILPPKEAFPAAKAAAEKAIGFDASLAEAHTSLASVALYYDWDWQDAEREFKNAIKFNPGYSTAYQWYAEYLAFMGKYDESICMGKRSMELDPLSPIVASNLAGFYWAGGQYDTAIEEYRKALEMDSNLGVARIYLGLTYAMAERYDEAIAELQMGIDLSGGDDSPHQGILGAIYGLAGRIDRGQQLLNRVIALSKTKYISPFQIATSYLALGQKELAFKWLDRAYAERDHWMVSVKVNPMFRSLRTDARFIELLRKMKLEH